MTRMPTRLRDAETEAVKSHLWIFYYDGDCGFCVRVVKVLSRIDVFRQVKWIPFQSLKEPPAGLSWTDLDHASYLDTRRGKLHEGFYSFRMLTLRLLPLIPLAPVLWFPGMNLFGAPAYRWIARNRYRISRCRISTPNFGRRHTGLGPGKCKATDQRSD